MTNGRTPRTPIRIPLTQGLRAALAAYRDALARQEGNGGPTRSEAPRNLREEEGCVAGRRMPCPRKRNV